MKLDEALDIAEKRLYSHHIQTPGAPGWRCYTDRERQKLRLVTYTIWHQANQSNSKR